MDGILRDEKDDVSQDYLVSRQVAHEYHSSYLQGFINRYSQMMQEPPKKQMAEQRFRATQRPKTKGGKPVKGTGMTPEEVETELTNQTEEPFLDPVSAAAGGFAGAGMMSLNQGMKLMPSLGRAVLSGVVGGIADYPVGAATEAVEEKAPSLAMPFNVITGLVSGATLEAAIEKGVVKALGKAADSDTIRRVVADMKMRLADESGQITVFHGSPHKFNKFSTDKIGTGEGAQAFGWGIYFTDKPDIAKHYADMGITKEAISKAKEIYRTDPKAADKIEEASDTFFGKLFNDLDEWQQENAINMAVKNLGLDVPGLKKSVYKATLHKGKTPDQYNYLEWDKSVSANNILEKVKTVNPEETNTYKELVRIHGKDIADQYKTTIKNKQRDAIRWVADHINDSSLKGSELYRGIANVMGSQRDASDFLLRAGIDGIRYPAGTLSGVKESKAFNYVVFDEGAVSTEAIAETGEQGQTIWKSVINSLNETVNNEIGAIGDINQVKSKLKKAGLTGKELETKAQEVLSAKLEGPAPIEKYVGNINIERLDTTDKIKNLLDLNTEQFKKQFFEARRGVRTWEETEKAAKKYTLEDLLGRKPGQAYNAEQSLNARVLQVTSAENLQSMTEKIRTGNASDNDKLEFMQAFGLHYAIMNQVAGITAEAGRTLNIFRKMAGGGDIKQIQEIMKNMPTTPEELAEALSTIDSPIGVNKLVKGAMRATTKDMFLEAWINGLLSGPQTHMINSLSNSLVAVWQVPERFLAGMLGRVLPGEQVIKETEALQQAYGLVEGFKDGLKAFGKVVRTGMTDDELTKLEAARYKAITAENVRQLPMIKKLAPDALQEGGVAARAVDFMGETIRLPGRFLMAEDEFFKGVGYRMELRTQAYRMASKEGLDGDALSKRMAEILQDPEKLAPNVHLAAVDAARYQTFTRPLESKLLGALSQSKNPVIKLIVPFVRTPTNILKYAFERTPLAAMSSKIRADISAGGARRDLALARISMGSMLMSVAAIMAAEGKITGGGPSDPKLSANLRRQGWQPYSIKIGDKYVQYGRLEPLGLVFGLGADFSEITGLAGDELSPESENLASAIVMAVSRNVTSKTWLRGLSEAVRAMDDPDRYGNRYIQNFAKSLVPSIVAQAERSIDPESEAVYNLSDSIKSRIPGYSKDLMPRRDLWGDPITTQISTGKRSWGEIAYSTISPIYISEGKNSPIDKELTRLKVGLSKPGKKQSIMGVPMELPSKLYDEFIKLSTKKVINGQDLKDFLNDFVKKPDYKQMTDERKEEEIRNIMTKARNVARMKMTEKYPQLRDIAIAWKQRLVQ